MAGKIEFGTFEAPEKVNEYIEPVKQLADKNDVNASIVVTVDYNEVQNTKYKIQRAANAIDKTARIRAVDESKVKFSKNDDGDDIGTGEVKITFTLTERHKARRVKKD